MWLCCVFSMGTRLLNSQPIPSYNKHAAVDIPEKVRHATVLHSWNWNLCFLPSCCSHLFVIPETFLWPAPKIYSIWRKSINVPVVVLLLGTVPERGVAVDSGERETDLLGYRVHMLIWWVVVLVLFLPSSFTVCKNGGRRPGRFSHVHSNVM